MNYTVIRHNIRTEITRYLSIQEWVLSQRPSSAALTVENILYPPRTGYELPALLRASSQASSTLELAYLIQYYFPGGFKYHDLPIYQVESAMLYVGFQLQSSGRGSLVRQLGNTELVRTIELENSRGWFVLGAISLEVIIPNDFILGDINPPVDTRESAMEVYPNLWRDIISDSIPTPDATLDRELVTISLPERDL